MRIKVSYKNLWRSTKIEYNCSNSDFISSAKDQFLVGVHIFAKRVTNSSTEVSCETGIQQKESSSSSLRFVEGRLLLTTNNLTVICRNLIWQFNKCIEVKLSETNFVPH